jgi:pyruvate carboxylase
LLNFIQIRYYSLGTFEFLVHETRPEYYFLEVNPRLQVEHTISEEIAGIDIVQCQLRLAQGATIEDLNLPTEAQSTNVPSMHAVQLRITAEDAAKGFTLSMGRVTGFQAPGGPGVRVDTHLSTTKPTTVGSSYDSLLAKLIVRSNTFEGARLKAIRALNDTVIAGITTNLDVLTGVVASRAFKEGACSTSWLESNLDEIMSNGKAIEKTSALTSREAYITSTTTTESNLSTTAGLGAAGVLFRKGDAFKMELTEAARANDKSAQKEEYLLRVDRVLTNNFPNQLTADVTFATSSTSQTYAMNITSTTQTSVASSRHRMAAADNATHIALPFPGQFVELLVDEGDKVREGEVLCVVRQMKMELEVRAPWAGTVKWVCDVEDGETVNEGLLVCELLPEDDRNRRKVVGPFKL